MAEPDYTTYAKVRANLSRLMNASDVSDDEILAKHDLYAKPAIDAALAGKGAPFTAGSAPALVQAIATLYSIAGICIDVFGKADKASEMTNKWIEIADGWLKGIRAGEYMPDGVTAGGNVVLSDPTEDRGHTQMVVGDETNWEFHPETREEA